MDATKVDTKPRCPVCDCSCGMCKDICSHPVGESKRMDVVEKEVGGPMWNASGSEMERGVVSEVKVRCDGDDVSGAALGNMLNMVELEKWLKRTVLDSDDDNAATVNGMPRNDMDLPEHGGGATEEMTTTDETADTLVISPSLDDKRNAWVDRFCKEGKPVPLRDLGLDWETSTWTEVVKKAEEAETMAMDDVPETPSTLTKADVFQFYRVNRCSCWAVDNNSVCGFCASRCRKRAREELREKREELKAAWRASKRVKSFDKVKKTLFVSDGDECENDGGWHALV